MFFVIKAIFQVKPKKLKGEKADALAEMIYKSLGDTEEVLRKGNSEPTKK